MEPDVVSAIIKAIRQEDAAHTGLVARLSAVSLDELHEAVHVLEDVTNTAQYVRETRREESQ